MRKWVLPLLLVLVSPSLLAASERVADILKDLSAHGYVSPTTAAARLQTAKDANDTHAPLEQQRRYYAALIDLSLPGRDTQLLTQALAQLHQTVKREHCKPCQATWLIGKAHAEILGHHLKKARTFLKQAESIVSTRAPALQLQLASAKVALARAKGIFNVAFGEAHVELGLANATGDAAAGVRALIDLAVADAELGYLNRATRIAAEAATQAQAIGYTAGLALSRLNQGYIYGLLDQRSRELHALQQALAIAKGVPGLAHIEVVAHANMSDFYLGQKDWVNALTHAREAARLASAHHDAYSASVALANLGIATARLGRVDDGLASLRKSMELARQAGNLRIEATINKELVKILESAGRYKEALDAMQAIADVNARITKQERDNAVLELQAKYDNQSKTREIERLSTQARLKDAQAAARLWQQRLWTTLAAVAVLAALLLVLWLLRARRANRRLAEDVASLTEQSSLDELTGVFNRRHFASLMQPYEGNDPMPVGLIMLDIDHFKQINDSFGHDAGDLVLKEVARRLQAFARGNDHVVRWGGEEFVLVLHDATPQALPSLAKRLLDTVAASPFHIGHQQLHVSTSAGCVVHPLESGCSWEQALRLADTAMYRAKRRGRNRAACVITVNAPLQQLVGGDVEAVMHSDMTVVTEVPGPVWPRPEIPA